MAVHCLAGLGRTGTLVALHCMVRYRFSASNAIGWLRICRPGSVLETQQQFLLEAEEVLSRQNLNRRDLMFFEEVKEEPQKKEEVKEAPTTRDWRIRRFRR